MGADRVGVPPSRRFTRDLSRGAALVEFAVVLPLILAITFGAIDYASVLGTMNSLRQGTREGARNAVVAEVGTDRTCAVAGAAPNDTTLALVCLVKNRVGVDASAVRVRIAWPGANAMGQSLILCAESPVRSASGLYSSLMDGRVLRAKVEMRIETASSQLAAFSEVPFSGSWSWC